MKYSVKYLLFVGIVFSCIWGSPKAVINIWHQMLYENRKVLREVCDDYENNNLDIKINLTYRETEELRSVIRQRLWEAADRSLSMDPQIRWGLSL